MNDPYASDDRQLADAWSGPERPACQEAQVRGAMRRTFALVREVLGTIFRRATSVRRDSLNFFPNLQSGFDPEV
jgi:hypothetical protein